jgi:hypothetical protein
MHYQTVYSLINRRLDAESGRKGEADARRASLQVQSWQIFGLEVARAPSKNAKAVGHAKEWQGEVV